MISPNCVSIGKVRVRVKIVSTTKSFIEALTFFNDRRYSLSVEDCVLLLAGCFGKEPLLFDMEGSIIENTGIYFYASLPNKDKFDIVQYQDPSQPALIPLTIFARFNRVRQELNFYNGALKKIQPGDIREFNDFSFFM